MTAAAPSAPPAAAAFGWRILTGLLGVLLAVILAGLNENVTKMALPDIRGALGLSYDQGTWFVAVYAAASVCAMAFAPLVLGHVFIAPLHPCSAGGFRAVRRALPVCAQLARALDLAHAAGPGRRRPQPCFGPATMNSRGNGSNTVPSAIAGYASSIRD